MFIFRANSRAFRCSAISGPRTPNGVVNTWGSYTVIKKAGVPDRGAGQVPDRIPRYFHGFVLARPFCL